MKKLVFTASVGAIALILAGCSGAASGEPTGGGAPTGEPIIIGMDLDRTGPGSSYNPLAGDVVIAAVDDINANGGILDRPIMLVEESSESDPARGPATYQALIEKGAVAVLGLSTASVVQQVKPLLEEEQLTTIAPIAVLDALTQQPDAGYVYSVVNPVSDFGNLFCGAFEAEGIEKVAYFSDDSPAIKSLAEPLKAKLRECVDLVIEEVAPLASTDLTAQASRIADVKPDAILVQSVGGPFEALAHSAFYQAMPDVPRFSQGAFGNQPDNWALATPGSLEGLVFINPLDRENPKTEELVDYMTPLMGADWKVNQFAIQGYDGLMLLLGAIERAGGTDDPEAIRAAMEETEGYEAHIGQSGFTLSYTPDKHIGADGLCGFTLFEFGADNTPEGKWAAHQPPC